MTRLYFAMSYIYKASSLSMRSRLSLGTYGLPADLLLSSLDELQLVKVVDMDARHTKMRSVLTKFLLIVVDIMVKPFYSGGFQT